MSLLELGEFARDSKDEISESHRLVVVIGNGQDVGLKGTGCGRGKFVLRVGAENGLRSDDDDLELADDLARCANRMLQLIAPHQSSPSRTLVRS